MKLKSFNQLLIAVLFTIGSILQGCSYFGDADKTLKGAGIGAAAGAALGAAYEAHKGGDWRQGALKGAAAGVAIGVTTGMILDRQEEKMRVAGIKTERDKNGKLLVKLAEDSLRFDPGKAILNAKGKKNLGKLADILKKYPENRMVIAGFSDSSGKASANENLSAKRANAVKAFLLKNGVPSRCIVEVKGFGEKYAIADNSTAKGRAINRRVEISITADEKEAKKNQTMREKL